MGLEFFDNGSNLLSLFPGEESMLQLILYSSRWTMETGF